MGILWMLLNYMECQHCTFHHAGLGLEQFEEGIAARLRVGGGSVVLGSLGSSGRFGLGESLEGHLWLLE